jgi:hypothetical protein
MKSKLEKIIYFILALAALTLGLSQNLQSLLVYGAGFLFAVIIVKLIYRKLRPAGENWLRGLILTILFLSGFFGSMAAVSALPIKLFLGFFGAVILFLGQIYPTKTLLEILILLTAFLVSLSVWAWNFFFSPSWWVILLVTFGVFYLLFWQEGLKLTAGQAEVRVFPLIASLILVEVAWAILFLPLYFLTEALVSLVVFYAIFEFSKVYFMGGLTKKQVLFHSIIIGIVLGLGLVSSAWQPLR